MTVKPHTGETGVRGSLTERFLGLYNIFVIFLNALLDATYSAGSQLRESQCKRCVTWRDSEAPI